MFSGFRSQLYAPQRTFGPRRVRVADTLQQEVSPSGTVRPACVYLHSGRCPLRVGNRGGFLIIIIECPFDQLILHDNACIYSINFYVT